MENVNLLLQVTLILGGPDLGRALPSQVLCYGWAVSLQLCVSEPNTQITL